MKLYKAIVWVGDKPGVRVELMAESGEQARDELKAKYGENALVTVWNEDDAARPR